MANFKWYVQQNHNHSQILNSLLRSSLPLPMNLSIPSRRNEFVEFSTIQSHCVCSTYKSYIFLSPYKFTWKKLLIIFWLYFEAFIWKQKFRARCWNIYKKYIKLSKCQFLLSIFSVDYIYNNNNNQMIDKTRLKQIHNDKVTWYFNKLYFYIQLSNSCDRDNINISRA